MPKKFKDTRKAITIIENESRRMVDTIEYWRRLGYTQAAPVEVTFVEKTAVYMVVMEIIIDGGQDEI